MNPQVSSALDYDPGSFRDATGRVFFANGEVYRGINGAALAQWRKLSQCRFFQSYSAAGKLVPTEELAPAEIPAPADDCAWQGLLRHERIPFISYPYEWCFGMMQDAAVLQLELLAAALEEDMTLKDASPYNIQWRGVQPVFIDIPSFIAWEPGDTWVGYRQFCQLFLYPLFLTAYKGVPFHPWLRGSIDGIEMHDCWRMMSWRDVLRRGVVSHVMLHNLLNTRYSDTRRDVGGDLRRAGFGRELIQANVRGLLKIVRGLKWRPPRSEWSDYDKHNNYEQADLTRKEAFVRRAASSRRWRLAWDLGANTGRFSRILGEHADCVVAMDQDYLAVQRFYEQLQRENCRNILPLIMDLADPSANRGWRGLERASLTNRQRPQLTLCLALIHHLVITAHIPMASFVRWLADLGSEVVLEFVARDDPMVQRLLRFHPEPFDDYDLPVFEQCLSRSFLTLQRETLSCPTRILYHLRPRNGS